MALVGRNSPVFARLFGGCLRKNFTMNALRKTLKLKKWVFVLVHGVFVSVKGVVRFSPRDLRFSPRGLRFSQRGRSF